MTAGPRLPPDQRAEAALQQRRPAEIHAGLPGQARRPGGPDSALQALQTL